MTDVWLAILAILMAASCSAQPSKADQYIKRLTEHWRWKQYWEGTTELGEMYRPGRQLDALLFWRTNQMPPSVGLCSTELGICQFYPNVPGNENSFETRIAPGEDSGSAYRRFLADSFGEKALTRRPLMRPSLTQGSPDVSSFSTEIVKIFLPSLDPPQAIRDRMPQARAEVDALVASLGCMSDEPQCNVHLTIPYYSHSDPSVPVFRACSGCANPKPTIVFMKLIESNWWHGAMDFNDNPNIVDRVRKQIERALMLEVTR
jgi:hypothetical protein